MARACLLTLAPLAGPRRSAPQSHKSLVDGVSALARRVQGDRELTNLIRRKFAIKCTTGALSRVIFVCTRAQLAGSSP